MKKKVGIFGGTFNPVHNGHIAFGRACMEKYRFDELLLIPANIPPHKIPIDLASGADRFNMLSIAAKNECGFAVSDIELVSPHKNEKSYTINTLYELKKQYALKNEDAELYLIIGSDMLLTFTQWHKYKDILRLAVIIAGAREKGEYAALKKATESIMKTVDFQCEIDIVDFPATVLSSTEIREAIRLGNDASELLPDGVYEYIKEKKLYLEQLF